MGGVGKWDEAGDAIRQTIRAYHGSPHDFDRFDASKIGSGEGAQAYGHGLYFAGNEDVADVYRKVLSGPYSQALAPDKDIPQFFAPGNVVPGYGGRDKVLRFIPGTEDEPWRWAVEVVSADQAGNPRPYERSRIHSTHPSLRDVDTFFGRGPTRPGHMYEVEIGHPEEALLDLDVPVGSQPKAVQDALAEFANAPSHFTFGQEGWRGKNAYMRAAEQGASPAEASRFFRERGIPGLRYLDGGSRSSGQGTRNYVIFPGAEDSIRILRKFAVPGAVGAGAAAQQGGGDGQVR